MKYFHYGYLFLIGTGTFLASVFFVWDANLNPILHWVLVIPAMIGLLICLYMFVSISLTTYTKYRYYKISCYRLAKKGYKERYFLYEMHEPCFRLIIKDLLHQAGLDDAYSQLREKSTGKDLRLEEAKSRLLASFSSEN